MNYELLEYLILSVLLLTVLNIVLGAVGTQKVNTKKWLPFQHPPIISETKALPHLAPAVENQMSL